MRVLQLVESFAAGTGQIAQLIAERLAAQGHDVTVAYGTRPETLFDVRSQVSPSVGLVALPWTDRTPRSQLLASRAVRRLVGELQPDVVHLHSSFAGAVGCVAIPAGIPTVYSPHAYSFMRNSDSRARRMVFHCAERLIARRVSVIGAVSHDEARLARTHVHARRVVVVANGIPELDQGQLPQPVPRQGRPLVIAAGRISEQRLPDESARILAALADLADVEWVGAGTPGGPDEQPLRAAGVPITGWLHRDQALARLAQATVYLHWSGWDGQSLAILEAMARDVCVVASDIEPNRELLDGTQLCGSERQAAQLARRLLTDSGAREAVLASQRRRRACHGAQRMADEWLALYAEIAGQTSRARSRRRQRPGALGTNIR